MTKLTAIYGGSFNPPTEGHLGIARQVRDVLPDCEVWLMVSPQNPLKPSAGMMPFQDRLAMTRLLVENERGLAASDFENQLGSRETAHLLRALNALYPERRFVWVMGADNMASLHLWQEWRFILDTVPVIVLPRPDFTAAALDAPAARYAGASRVENVADLASGNGWYLFPGEGVAISATHQRDALRAGLATPHLSPAVRAYIQSHQLKL